MRRYSDRRSQQGLHRHHSLTRSDDAAMQQLRSKCSWINLTGGLWCS